MMSPAPVAELSARFQLASARQLPRVGTDHPCGRLHGHTFDITLVLRGPIDPHFGWVADFADISAAWTPIAAQLDHRVLNDVPGLENPTSEVLAVWIWRALVPTVPLLHAIHIGETGGFVVTYRGE
jgi:6-pyruvoyltetrahydropterin/6-carboxytetrahydropterin synthase